MKGGKRHEGKYVSGAEAGRLLGISRQAVIDMIEDKFPDAFMVGRTWAIEREEVMKLKEQRESERDETK